MSKHDDEIRSFKISVANPELRESGENEMILEGYAAVFERETVLYSIDGTDYKEIISRGAFDSAKTDGCFLKFNHNNECLPLARVRGGSMTLTPDDYGLKFRAVLFNTSYSRDVYEIVKAGGIDECSFAFNIAEDGYEYDRSTHTARINKVSNLWDCAIVENPAYGGTSVSARSKEFLEAEAEKERQECLKAERDAKWEQLERHVKNTLMEVMIHGN